MFILSKKVYSILSWNSSIFIIISSTIKSSRTFVGNQCVFSRTITATILDYNIEGILSYTAEDISMVSN